MTNFVKTPATASRNCSPEHYGLDKIDVSKPFIVFEPDTSEAVRHVHMRGNRPGTYGNTAVGDAKRNWNRRGSTTEDRKLSQGLLKDGRIIVYLRDQVNAVLKDFAFE